MSTPPSPAPDSNIHTHKTSRGYTYQYYHYRASSPSPSPSSSSPKSKPKPKPTLLFLHGFPLTSADWSHQITYFRSRGYSVLAPDLLGYGGSDKPIEPEMYRLKLMARDVLDILDREGLESERVVGVGHDWGSTFLSRLAIYHPTRFLGLAFICNGYLPPQPNNTIEGEMQSNIERCGHPIVGYQVFFNEDRAPRVIEEHMDSFISACYHSGDRAFFEEVFSPPGALEEWILADKTSFEGRGAPSDFLKFRTESLLKNGMTGPTNWYKAKLRGLNNKDDSEISPQKATIPHPVWYCGATLDPSSPVDVYERYHREFCPNTTFWKLAGGHMLFQYMHAEVNEELYRWVRTVVEGGESESGGGS